MAHKAVTGNIALNLAKGFGGPRCLPQWGRTTFAATTHIPLAPWAPAQGGLGGKPPTLEKIRVDHAHPGNTYVV